MSDNSFFVTANLIEALLWALIGFAFLLRAIWLRTPARRMAIITGLTFLFFGLLDVAETRTGAWWRPWWLFAWKASCVILLTMLLTVYVRRRDRPS